MTIKFSLPQKYISKVASTNFLNKIDLEVLFEVIEPNTLEFIPGQFISINCGNGTFRSYSISSSSLSKTQVGLIVAVAHEGIGSNFLKNLKVGDTVEFIGPSGRFVLPENLKETLVFLATGTGVAPILSMIDYLANTQSDANIKLYFGIRDSKELFKLDQIRDLKNKLKSFDYKICFSQELPKELDTNCIKGRVTDAFNIKDFDIASTQYFICGNPYMVTEVSEALENNFVPKENIFHEKFTTAQKKV